MNVPLNDTDTLLPVVNVPCAQPDAGGVNTYVPTGEDMLYMVFGRQRRAAGGEGGNIARPTITCIKKHSSITS